MELVSRRRDAPQVMIHAQESLHGGLLLGTQTALFRGHWGQQRYGLAAARDHDALSGFNSLDVLGEVLIDLS
jgi:hypothetical protein